MRVLPVDLHQLLGGLGQRAHRRHAPVDPGPRTAFGRHGARDDHLPLAFGLVHHEACLDQCLRGAGPDDARTGPPAEHELERLDDQRLAGARLAGQDRHALPEGERKVLDDAEIAHPQLGQHATTAPTARDRPAAET